MKPTSHLENNFARCLLACRFLILFAVFGALLGALLLFLKGTVEILFGISDSFRHLVQLTKAGHKEVILNVIPAVDNYLFATVLLVFAVGIYKLFIGEVNPSLTGSASRPGWLQVETLDDLRTQICAGVIIILTINFFDISLSIPLDRPLDLLLLGGGIFLIAAALSLTYRRVAGSENEQKEGLPSPPSAPPATRSGS